MIVPREDCGQDDTSCRRFLLAMGDNRANPVRSLDDVVVTRRSGGQIIRAGEDYDDFGINVVEFSVLQSPENVLSCIASPTKIRGVPAEEVRLPVLHEGCVLGIGASPTARN